MIESEQQCARLEDIDEDTFVRFLEFAYTGDYSVPHPDIVLGSTDVVAEDTGPQHLAGQDLEDALRSMNFEERVVKTSDEPSKDDRQSLKKTRKKRKIQAEGRRISMEEMPQYERGTDLWQTFRNEAHVNKIKAWKPPVNNDRCEDYGPIFLCHAELYVFSDRYNVKPLQDLALQKLRLTLTRFNMFEERINDIVQLVRYTYANTVDFDDGIDRLRNLVSDYVVCHMETIAEDKDFQDLLQEPGAAAKDIMLKLLHRLD